MGKQHRVLIVEDDEATRALVAAYLADAGYRVAEAANGQEMRHVLSTGDVDLVLLDINLPGADGLSLAQDLRQQSDIGIVFVTGRASDIDCVVGLELGADDYIVKPFEPRVLLARVKSVLRRRADRPESAASASSVRRFEGWSVDLIGRRLLTPEGQEVALTRAEFDLLAVFVTRPGRLLTLDQIIGATGGANRAVTDGSVYTLISRLRRRLGDDPRSARLIVTCHGQGYKFTADVH